MNDKKICFIICTNSKLFLDENMRYIERLVVPEGYEIDVISIAGANSITEGYNEGMKASDAKYKVYMHQDVFILYPYFLQSILDIFNSDSRIGMIGLVGAEEIASDGMMWHNVRKGLLYEACKEECMEAMDYNAYRYRIADGLWDVKTVDGLVMVTSADVPWREDIFDGWDFYDVSQSFEMIRAGYKVVVPEQKLPWCLHDDGILNFKNYDKYRKICLKEYSDFFRQTKEE